MAHKDENSWKLIFDGNLLRPKDRDLAREKFAQRFASDPKQLDRIFSGKPIVLRRDLHHRSAKRIQADLTALGMHCRVVSAEPAKTDSAVATPSKSGVYTEQEIEVAFTGQFKRPRTGLVYRVSLLGVAALMVLLPVLYLALVGAVAYGVVWQASNNFPTALEPAAQYLGLLGYGLPIVAGSVLFLFLIKPFCARQKGICPPVVLDPLRQPALFYLVEQITQRVGAPMPGEIRVAAGVNASASLRNGIFSRELTLTIGMPLFLGMNVQTLSGILAHEFGHFAQSTGMRLRLVIERINHWLYRRAYEPDSWDRSVQRMAGSRFFVVKLAGLTSRVGIFITRRILIGLASAAAMISRYMFRQMEFDADRYEVNMTGSDQFRDTAIRLRTLAEGFAMAASEAHEIWRDNRLPNDLPTLAIGHADAIDAAGVAKIAAGIASRHVDVMDTHPPDGDRMRVAEAMKQQGVLAHTGPAQRLIHHCDELCRRATFAWYRDQGYAFNSDNLVSVDMVRAELTKQDEQFEALRRYLGGNLIDHRVLPIAGVHSLLDKPENRLRDVLRAWREPLASAAVATLGQQFTDAFETLVHLTAAESLSRLHLPFDHDEYGVESGDTVQIQEQIRAGQDAFETAQTKLAVHEGALAKRFVVSLALGCRDGLLDLEDVEECVYALRALGQVCEHTVDIIGLERRLRSLIEFAEANQDNQKITNAITDALADYQRWIDRVNNALIRVPNPLRPGTHLGEAVWQWTPDREYVDNNPEAAAQTLRGIVDALRFLNVRITGRLAEHAERVESTLGA